VKSHGESEVSLCRCADSADEGEGSRGTGGKGGYLKRSFGVREGVDHRPVRSNSGELRLGKIKVQSEEGVKKGPTRRVKKNFRKGRRGGGRLTQKRCGDLNRH